MLDPHSQRILILDFGSQYTQLIARRVREAGVYCELHPYDITSARLRSVMSVPIAPTALIRPPASRIGIGRRHRDVHDVVPARGGSRAHSQNAQRAFGIRERL